MQCYGPQWSKRERLGLAGHQLECHGWTYRGPSVRRSLMDISHRPKGLESGFVGP